MQPLGQLARPCLHTGSTTQLQWRGYVVGHRHGRVVDELLIDHGHIALAHRHAGRILPIDQHTPFTGSIQPGHDAHQTGLAGLRRPQQHRDRAAVQAQVERVQPRLSSHTLANALQNQFHCCTSSAVIR